MDYTQKIKSICPRQILSSRGYPTVEVDIVSVTDEVFRSSAPSGESTGSKEAAALVDRRADYGGRSVTGIIRRLEQDVLPMVLQSRINSQVEFDSLLYIADNTKTLATYGANTLLPLSMSFCKLQAKADGLGLCHHIAGIMRSNCSSGGSEDVVSGSGIVSGSSGSGISSGGSAGSTANNSTNTANTRSTNTSNANTNIRGTTSNSTRNANTRGCRKVGLPVPCFNILNGGSHSGNALLFQEIMVSFQHASFERNLESAAVFYAALKAVISERYGALYTGFGDEGGFMPPIRGLEEGLELVRETRGRTGQEGLRIAIDSAATYFYKDGRYTVRRRAIGASSASGEISGASNASNASKEVNGKCTDGHTNNHSDKHKHSDKHNHSDNYVDVEMTGDELIEYYASLLATYPEIFLLEDPFAETDIPAWQKFTAAFGGRVIVLGDDLLVTNPEIIRQAVDGRWCNAVLIKPNQIGTVSKTLEVVRVAYESGFRVMVSHRSGETEDAFIADLSVGIGADFFKSGAPRGERLVKYNQLLRIEEELLGSDK